MEGAPHTIFDFENFTLDIGAAELRQDNVQVPIETQVFDLLVLLVRNHDRVVTRDEIIEIIWSGRIVSESAVSTWVNALRRALGDDGSVQRLVKTIHGRGFRFGVKPVSNDGKQAVGDAAQESGTTKPSIAIIPFQALSGDIELEYFADGIAEDIINALSRFHELSVIARNSSFTFKGQSVPAREIAQRLGVKYVLEGSVRLVGQRIRVAVQLIDALADRTLWSDRYDGDLDDIFSVQDEIAAKAVTAIAPQTQYAEMSSAYRKEITNLSDWERVMRARWHMDKYSRDDTRTALQILAQVIESKPDLAIAHSSVALCHYHKLLNTWGDDPSKEIQAAELAARQAVGLDAYDASALAVLGLAAGFAHRFDECFERLEAALAINPNLASGYGYMATMRGCQGDIERTLKSYERAIQLSPADPTRTLWMSGKGIALFLDGQYDAVLVIVEKMLRIQPDYGPALRQKAASLVRLGRMDEAKEVMDEILRHMPQLSAERLAKMVPVQKPEHRGDWLDALRDAGLPE